MHTMATLKAPHIIVPLPGPKAWAWIERDDQVISPSYTRAYPLVAARGHGCTIEDVDGNLFLDFTAGIAVTATGHAHPDVVAAIADQASRLIHMSGTDFYYAPEIELAERLAKVAPGPGAKKVFFCNSGAEAIEAALKLARHRTGRSEMISFLGAFHGRTYGAMSLGGSKAIHRHGFGPMLGGMHHLHYDCERAEFEELFATVCPPDEVAAIFVEPIQGEGGYRVPSARFLPMLREVCDQHGILLVVDEVQSGIGRTGKMFAIEHFGVVPDITCIAKGIASGMPLGAIITKTDVMNWPPGSHASTFGGNPISCRAALATLDLVEGSMMHNAAERGEQLTIGLRRLAGDSTTGLANPRGIGLMQAIDVTASEGSPVVRRHEIIQSAFKHGLLLLGCGKAALRICPALCVTAEETETMLDLLHDVCRHVPGA